MTSKYHANVRQVIDDIYPDKEVRDEQNLWEIIKGVHEPRLRTSFNRLYIDIYVPEENLAIEVHGEQHEKPVQFAKEIDVDEALHKRKHLDYIKQKALNRAGVAVVIIWYDEIEGLTKGILQSKIHTAQQIANTRPEQSTQLARPAIYRTAKESYRARASSRRNKKKRPKEDPKKRQDRLDKAKRARQAAYLKAKEFKNVISRRTTSRSRSS